MKNHGVTSTQVRKLLFSRQRVHACLLRIRFLFQCGEVTAELFQFDVLSFG